jgi:hypothetical protein
MDLIVEANNQAELDPDQLDSPFATALHNIEIETLNDFVQHNLISQNDLRKILEASKNSTRTALQATNARPMFVPGTRRINLGRFSNFITHLPDINSADA